MCRLIPFTVASALICTGAAHAETYTYRHENVLGTELELRVEAACDTDADAAESRVLAEIDRLDGILSSYSPKSELRQWQAGGATAQPISPDLMGVLQAADIWRARSGGAFEPAVAAVSATWQLAARENRFPSSAEIDLARAHMNSGRWTLDAAANTATPAPGETITLDGLAKGYIIDRACGAAVEDNAVSGVVVNIGGDLRAAGQLSIETAIANPFADSETSATIARVPLADGAMATSGNYQRFTEVAGQRISSIFDPRTGMPAAEVVSATVVARNAIDADALATALNVLHPAEGVALIDGVDGAACLIVGSDGGITKSARWSGPAPERIQLAQAKAPNDRVAANDSWGGRYELVVDFEVANPETDGRYRRPYVGIWICDHEGFPIRTLLLWQQKNGLRWLPSLREWYRDDQIRSFVDESDLIKTISRATRPPGKYQAVWDGKDDAGLPVPAGRYTVHLEAAREHGTHQTLTAEFAAGAETFEKELDGNVEISQASIHYRLAPSAPQWHREK